MSFLKISDPKKRDLIVEEFLKTKRNIQENFMNERLGDISAQRELTKFFKPITESQKDVKESLLSELKPIRENLKELPAAITFPQRQAIAAPPEDEEEEDVMRVGKIAHQYLSEYATKQNVDKTFGIYKNPIDKQYYIGNTPIYVLDNDLIIGDQEYEGTPGLWELIISKKPDENVYSKTDFDNYAKILVETSALKQNNNPAETAPKSSKSWKWRNLLRQIWKDRSQYEGQGIGGETETVVIPSDPNALLDRLDLLLASKAAGNTGVRNELVSICDELLRQKVMNKSLYKNFMLHI